MASQMCILASLVDNTNTAIVDEIQGLLLVAPVGHNHPDASSQEQP